MRIVSLLPSATEIVCALGLEERLVGRSHECDWPPSVRRLPVCTEPAFDTGGNSAEIDRRVKETLRDALSVYRVHEDVLRELRPDLILTQSQCDVCAVGLADVERSLSGWVGGQPRIVSFEPNGLADVWGDIERVADALGEVDRGISLAVMLGGRVEAIAAEAQTMARRPSVACIEWIDPLMAAGNWVPELVELAGGVNLFGEAGKHSPWMTWEELVASDPEVIVLLPCGFDIERTRGELPFLTTRREWKGLRAVQAGRVYVTDGNQYFNRPGPRLVESLEILAELLHPEAFRFGHEGTGWQQVGEVDA